MTYLGRDGLQWGRLIFALREKHTNKVPTVTTQCVAVFSGFILAIYTSHSQFIVLYKVHCNKGVAVSRCCLRAHWQCAVHRSHNVHVDNLTRYYLPPTDDTCLGLVSLLKHEDCSYDCSFIKYHCNFVNING